MGWTLQYKANTQGDDIEKFVSSANLVKLKLSWLCEKYYWEVKDDGTAFGITKVQFSLLPRRDFIKILEELKRLSTSWPSVRIYAADDFVLGDWWNVQNIKIDQLDL